jgi:uncharacterized membrane protein YeaQ/YmgE (transglycosylase-associated protein family)
LGIIVIVVLHRIHYHWTGMSSKEAVRAQLAGPLKPFVILAIALFTMAGVFYFVTGFANALALTRRVKGGQRVSRAARGALASGLWLIALSYLQRVFLANGFPPGEGDGTRFPAGQLTGWLRYGRPVPFKWSLVTEPGTLALIGLILVILTLLLSWYLAKPRRLTLGVILLISAAAVLLAAPLLRFFLRPVYEAALASGRILQAFSLGLVTDDFGLFPNLAFGLVGALLGAVLAGGLELKPVRRRALLVSLGLFLVALAGAVLADRQSELGRRIGGVAISTLELALFITLWVGLSRLCDSSFRPAGWVNRSVARFGRLALTVYFLEPVLAESLRRGLTGLLGDGWRNGLFSVVAFGLLCLAGWWGIISVWERYGFVGSLEWISVRLSRALGKTDSGKLRTPEDSRVEEAAGAPT